MLVELDKDVALVFFEFLTSREDEIMSALALETPERNALWLLEAALERVLLEPFSPEYQSLLVSARKSLVERGGEIA